ncbi:hypothetical protein BD560DRAFT_394346 [Blakeslea trispora]|nr:hypothetical protein BD560DRAFT_394346 [Blakeslea trispora]
MVRKKSRGRPTKKETEHFEPLPLGPKDLLQHVKPNKIANNNALNEEHEPHLFVKLLEAINMRASHITQVHPQFPRMDLSALYCVGMVIQEYVHHLSTDILQTKQALEARPTLSTYFSQAELEAQSIEGLLQTYRPHRPKSSLIGIRPNLETEAGALERKKRAHASHQTDVITSKTGYEDLLKDPEWKGVLRKKRDPEADAKAAAIRRETSEKQKREAAENHIHHLPYAFIPHSPIKLDTEPTHDIFDIASQRKRPHPTSDRKKKRLKATGF